MSFHTIATTLALLAATASSPFLGAQAPAGRDPHPTVDLYVLAGQSNAEGLGPREELPDGFDRPIAGVEIWNDFRQAGRWEPLQVGVNHLSTNDSRRSDRVGMEAALARGLSGRSPGRSIRLVKLAVDGAPLGPVPGRLSWDPATGQLQALLEAKLRAAVDALRAESLEPTWRGLVWYQGETDAAGRRLAEGYPARLRALHARTEAFAETLGLRGGAPLRWVVVQIHPDTFGAVPGAFVAAVRGAQRRFAATTPGCSLIDTAGLELQRDRTHLTTDALVELGSRVATELSSTGRPTTRRAPVGGGPTPRDVLGIVDLGGGQDLAEAIPTHQPFVIVVCEGDASGSAGRLRPLAIFSPTALRCALADIDRGGIPAGRYWMVAVRAE